MDQHEFVSLTSEEVFRKAVADQFSAVNMRLSTQDVAIDGLVKQGDATAAKVDVILDKTSVLVDAWDDGVQIKKVFCRLAKAWDFMLKKMLLPLLGFIAVMAILRAIFSHEAIPEWATALFKSFVGL